MSMEAKHRRRHRRRQNTQTQVHTSPLRCALSGVSVMRLATYHVEREVQTTHLALHTLGRHGDVRRLVLALALALLP